MQIMKFEDLHPTDQTIVTQDMPNLYQTKLLKLNKFYDYEFNLLPSKSFYFKFRGKYENKFRYEIWSE